MDTTTFSYTDQLMRYLIDPDLETYADCRRSIFTNLTPSALRNEAHVLYGVLYKFREKGIHVDTEFLELYLSRNIGDIVKANRKYLDLNAYAELAQAVDSSVLVGDISDKALLYAGGVIKYFADLHSLPEPSASLQDCNLLLEKFKLDYSTSAAETVLHKGLSILTTGLQEGRRLYSGFSDASDYIRRNLSQIEGIVDTNQGMGILSYEDLQAQESTELAKPITQVGDYGDIEELNQAYGGIFTQSLISVVAPLKGGKTKLCTSLIYRAVVEYRQNVTLWAVEGSIEELMAELQAIHFDRTYNSNVHYSQAKTGVTRDTILKDRWDVPGFHHPDWKEKCLLLAEDLGTNPKYGRITFIDRPLIAEEFTDTLTLAVEGNASKLVFVDYLGLARSNQSSREPHLAVRQVYQEASAFVKRHNIALLSPAQYTQDAIRDMARKGTDLRAGVAGSSEVLRSSDVAFALWRTPEDELANRMTIMNVASRSAPYDDFQIATDMGACSFVSIVK